MLMFLFLNYRIVLPLPTTSYSSSWTTWKQVEISSNFLRMYSTNFRNKLECLYMASFFQPSLKFVGKEAAYLIEEPFRCSTLGLAPDLARKK
jgi:hypothetical protein